MTKPFLWAPHSPASGLASLVGRSVGVGVSLAVDALEFLEGGVGVDFGGADAFVPEQFLDDADFGPVVEHGGGEGMAQHVGAALLLCGDAAEVVLYDILDMVALDASGAGADEEGVVVGHVVKHLVAHTEVFAELRFGFGHEGYDALLVALAGDLDGVVAEVDVAGVEPDELGQSHAGGVEELEDGVVAMAFVGVGEGGVVEQAVHFRLFDEMGQGFLLLWPFDALCGVVPGEVTADEEAVERAKRAQAVVDRRGRASVIHHRYHPFAYVALFDGGPVDGPALGFHVALEECERLVVGFQGALRVVAFGAYIMQKIVLEHGLSFFLLMVGHELKGTICQWA